ncbi:HNH endonuclease [Anthocerotibacter panamensis]|uniref:HNH endonuclease n=1 Tax=Anthocerotibacter panamensis TaxID=2857077 RepID=UPI001C40265F|nr:HNH endonuclease [Anthocerotibacter panamensis]
MKQVEKNLNFYLDKFSKLKVDLSRGSAPYKPVLLLSVIELIGQGIIVNNQIPISPELIATYLKYKNCLSEIKFQADLAQPFYFMKSEGFWHLKPRPNHEIITERLNTLKKLREHIQYAYLDNKLFILLQDQIARNSLTDAIVTRWFPRKTAEIEELLQINSFQEFQDRLRERGGVIYDIKEAVDEEISIVRDAGFRRTVISLYDYRCVFCKLRVINLSQNIVDGAHIKPFSRFFDNRFSNGISLCKNHHWAFDQGWFAIEDNYTIKVSANIWEDSPNSRLMCDFEGELIFLPQNSQFLPDIDALSWHRENIFNQGERLLLY